MDDETAEIELLEQNLNKTRQISQRMTTILTSFDGRLVKLEKSILPLYNSTQILTKRGINIDSALQKIYEVASNQEGIAAEEALILRGPQSDELEAYTSALERLNASIAFTSGDRGARDTARLLDTGTKKLAQLFTKRIAEASSGTPPDSGMPPAPPRDQLRPLVAALRALPLPATHPSHPASAAVLSTLKEAQRGYAEMRGAWVKKCWEGRGRRMLERVETEGEGNAGAAGKEVGRWVDSLLDAIQAEHTLLDDVAPLPSQPHLAAAHAALLGPPLSLVSSTLSSLTSVIKRSLHRYTFLALAVYGTLSSLQPHWDAVISASISGSNGAQKADGFNALKEAVHALRGVCMRSFPEFLADVKMAALGKPGAELGTGIADFTASTIRYLEQLPDVREAVGAVLLALGDGNWRMGDGVQVNKGPKLGEGSEKVILEHYVYDVVSTLLTSLTTLSRTSRRPAFGSVFLLNNVSHLRTALLRPRAPIYSLLPKPTQESIHSAFRTAKATYFDASFSPLIQALADDKDKVGSGSKAATKEKFTRFFDLLEEVRERHRLARVLEDDEDDRGMLADEVTKLVVPTLQRFVQRHKEKEFSKNPQKYIKLSPEEVEAQIRSFYE
ncbi:hypothetical protein EVG20_g6281 [Dentipellis fragilis]|uniref:Exocyst complex protein EXO70 n=1 Tax=Dentipellis fragilis TaxID=205917 RepID=A0A4Y9YNU2_9AGAM|nr:hypothetical protein EVG20_g6281 [Dentipellis fragilis]